MRNPVQATINALISLRFYSQAQPITRMFQDDKRRLLLDIAKHSHFGTFVETGTYLGETTRLLADICERVISVEIDPALYARAVELFTDRPGVELLLGDSGQVMPQILEGIQEPAIFWLDGHYSGGFTGRGDRDSPIERELKLILDHPIKEHIIVIDDARLFRGGRGGYPMLRSVIRLVKSSPYSIALNSDLIRIQRDDI